MIVTHLWVITSSDSIVYLILSTLVQCGIYTSKSMLNILKGLHYVWQPSLGTVATRTFYQWLISRRSQTILCMLFKIIRDLCFFLPNMISTRSNLSQHTDMQLLLQQPFARSNAYQHSLLPNILHVWNLLPESVINLPFQCKAMGSTCAGYTTLNM